MAESGKQGIELFTAATPNGKKISIALEELGIPYTFRALSFDKNEQKDEWYTKKINPNGRIPAIVDHNRGAFSVFESGAIFLYLAQHYDKEYKFSFKDEDLQSQVVQWLFWMNAGLGPMQGQAGVFIRSAPEKIPFAIERYVNETKRLYTVLEKHLAEGNDYLVGNKYTVADMSTFPWVRACPLIGIDLASEFPHLNKWVEKIEERPAVKKGLAVPNADDIIAKIRNDPVAREENAKKIADRLSK